MLVLERARDWASALTFLAANACISSTHSAVTACLFRFDYELIQSNGEVDFFGRFVVSFVLRLLCFFLALQ